MKKLFIVKTEQEATYFTNDMNDLQSVEYSKMTRAKWVFNNGAIINIVRSEYKWAGTAEPSVLVLISPAYCFENNELPYREVAEAMCTTKKVAEAVFGYTKVHINM